MLITLDTSINCTALIINNDKHVFVNRVLSSNKTKNKKWFELCADYITYHFIDYDLPTDYSAQEVYKIKKYSEVACSIGNVIKENIKKTSPEYIKIAMESYSYSSVSGPLIDLVTIGTCIRKELLAISPNLEIISPASLKHESAKMTYPPTYKGKKVQKTEYRNHQGISGGRFNKFEMYRALTENESLASDPWVDFLIKNQNEIFDLAKIPKPMEDVNDAKLLYEILLRRSPLI